MQTCDFTVGLGLAAGRRPNTQQAGGGTGAVITATTAPILLHLKDNQTPADRYSTGSYVSTAGPISSAVESYLVNGAPQSSNYDLNSGDMVQVTVLVTDSSGNNDTFYTAVRTVTSASGSASLSIIATRGNDQIAPEGIWFEAVPISGFDVSSASGNQVYDPTFHDIHYAWSFGDTGTFFAPVNILTSWNDKNVGYGRQVSHVFELPGSYTVTCTARDRSGNVAVQTYVVTVKNPATEWAGMKTIVVSLDNAETWAGEPPGADRHTSMLSAETAYQALSGTGRILLKADGSTYHFSDHRIRNVYPNFHVGTWGSGARPIVGHKFWLNDMDVGKDATFWGIQIQQSWDSTTEGGATDDGIFVDRGRHATFYDVAIDGCTESIQFSTAVTSGTFVFQDVNITNWKGYGFLMAATGTTKVGMKGCCVAQHVDALGGGKHKGTGHNEHGPIRWSGNKVGSATQGYFGACDLFSNIGWSTAAGPSHQAPFRTAGGNNDMFLNLERISLEGGVHQLNLTDSAGGSEALATNILVDKFVAVGGDVCQHNIRIGLGAVTIRNGVSIQANVPTETTTSWRSIVLLEDAGDDSTNLAEPVQIYNNNLVNLLNDTNDPNRTANFEVDGAGTFANETFENNILNMPNSASNPNTAEAPLDTAELWTARYRGLRHEDHPILDTAYAPPAGTVALYVAVPGSSAENDAGSGTVAIDDIHGNVRGSTTSRGAAQ